MPKQARDLIPRDGQGYPGLSQKLLEQHHDVLYKGYVNKINEIEAKAAEADPAEANATYSLIRELKREEVFCTNAVRLHEGFFQNLGGSDNTPTGDIVELVKEDFGSWEKWEAEFRALGIAARGWVVLAFDWEDRKLHNYLSDIHSDGVWGCTPIMIMDVYEHAYYLDYGAGRKGYIDAFFQNVNWTEVNGRIQSLEIKRYR
jgi:Fe-Mn family superoxide dismutase